MSNDAVRFEIHGLPELEADLLGVIVEVEREAQQGFMPERRYHGAGGIPFTGDTITMVAEAKGFMVTDGR